MPWASVPPVPSNSSSAVFAMSSSPALQIWIDGGGRLGVPKPNTRVEPGSVPPVITGAMTGVLVGTRVEVLVGAGVEVPVGAAVEVLVGAGVEVLVGAGVNVLVGSGVEVFVGAGVEVFVGAGVEVLVGTGVEVFVGAGVNVLVGTGVEVFVGTEVDVFVGTGVTVLVGVTVGVSVGGPRDTLSSPLTHEVSSSLLAGSVAEGGGNVTQFNGYGPGAVPGLIRKLHVIYVPAWPIGANGSVGSRKKTLTYGTLGGVTVSTASVRAWWFAGSAIIVQSTLAPLAHVPPPHNGSKTDVLGSQASPQPALDTWAAEGPPIANEKVTGVPAAPD